jgi:hypothetical protein
MNGAAPADLPKPGAELIAQLQETAQRRRSLLAALPTNRAYFDAMAAEASRTLENQA